MNAALGGVSAGGIGSPESDVSQNGGGPNAFVASHSIGNAGGVTLSKFSLEVTRLAHDGHRPRPGRIPATVDPIAMHTAMTNSIKITFRSRLGMSVCFSFLTIVADERKSFYKYCVVAELKEEKSLVSELLSYYFLRLGGTTFTRSVAGPRGHACRSSAARKRMPFCQRSFYSASQQDESVS